MDENTLRLFEELRTEGARAGQRPYLVLDGAWQEDLIKSVRRKSEGWEPLMGAPGEDKQDVHVKSPLLVDLAHHDAILEQWLEGDFKDKIGIIVFSGIEIGPLRTSLKRFLSVMTPEGGKPQYFRFYHGRTLYCFLKFGFAEQWADFFRDISIIAAPYDYSPGWAVYKPVGDALKFGIEKQDRSGWFWKTWTNEDRAVDNYKITFPFRAIQQPQYDDIMRCAELGFHHEIYDFLLKAFPEETKDIPKQQILEFIEQTHSIAEINGFGGSPENLFYWSVLSFCAGDRFYEREPVAEILKHPHQSKETRLELVIYNMGLLAKNEHLIDLVDIIESKTTYADGRYVIALERSGKVVEEGFA